MEVHGGNVRGEGTEDCRTDVQDTGTEVHAGGLQEYQRVSRDGGACQEVARCRNETRRRAG